MSGGMTPMSGGMTPMSGGMTPMSGGITSMSGGMTSLSGGMSRFGGGISDKPSDVGLMGRDVKNFDANNISNMGRGMNNMKEQMDFVGGQRGNAFEGMMNRTEDTIHLSGMGSGRSMMNTYNDGGPSASGGTGMIGGMNFGERSDTNERMNKGNISSMDRHDNFGPSSIVTEGQKSSYNKSQGNFKDQGAAENIRGGNNWIGGMDDDEYDDKGLNESYQKPEGSSWRQNRGERDEKNDIRDRGGRGEERGAGRDFKNESSGDFKGDRRDIERNRDEGSYNRKDSNRGGTARGGRGEERQSRGDKRLAMEIVKNPFDPAERSDRSQSNRIDEERFINPGMNPPAPDSEGRTPQMPPNISGRPQGSGPGGQGAPDYGALLQYLQFYQEQMGTGEK